MSWFDEIPQLFRLTIGEIGFIFYIREKMKNDLVADSEELRLTLGPQWETIISNLKNHGVLDAHSDGSRWHFSVRAPGDKKRERCKKLGRKKRVMMTFETGISKGSL
jgi:hypothetical protein